MTSRSFHVAIYVIVSITPNIVYRHGIKKDVW